MKPLICLFYSVFGLGPTQPPLGGKEFEFGYESLKNGYEESHEESQK